VSDWDVQGRRQHAELARLPVTAAVTVLVVVGAARVARVVVGLAHACKCNREEMTAGYLYPSKNGLDFR